MLLVPRRASPRAIAKNRSAIRSYRHALANTHVSSSSTPRSALTKRFFSRPRVFGAASLASASGLVSPPRGGSSSPPLASAGTPGPPLRESDGLLVPSRSARSLSASARANAVSSAVPANTRSPRRESRPSPLCRTARRTSPRGFSTSRPREAPAEDPTKHRDRLARRASFAERGEPLRTRRRDRRFFVFVGSRRFVSFRSRSRNRADATARSANVPRSETIARRRRRKPRAAPSPARASFRGRPPAGAGEARRRSSRSPRSSRSSRATRTTDSRRTREARAARPPPPTSASAPPRECAARGERRLARGT